MKKINIALASLLALSVLSCNKELAPSENLNKDENLVLKTFTASYGEEDTKVSVGTVDNNKVNLVWSAGDVVHILAENQTPSTAAETSTAAEASNINGNSAEFTAYTNPDAKTYYAVYPASAVATENTWVTGTDSKKALCVTIPAEQKAEHNSFDPKAYVATAVTSDNHLAFKPIVSAIKFQLGAEASSVEKVVFQINGSTNVAGTGVLYIDNFRSHTWLGGSSTAFTQVTLTKPDGGFQSDTDYYITFRPNKCTTGITLYFCLSDGTVKKLSSSKQLFTSPIGAVKSFGDILSKATTLSAKDAYDLGFDILVGDVTLNKTKNGTATIISNAEADEVDIQPLLKAGVNFIDGKFKLVNNKAISTDTYVIANGIASINFNAKNIYHQGGTLGFKNVAMDGSTNTNYLVANTNATANSEKFILDGCKVTTAKQVYYNSIDTFNCKNLYVVDTDVQLTAGCNVFDFYKCSTTTPSSITIKNSIFYAEANSVARIINTSKVGTVTFENNTVFNLHAGVSNGLIHATSEITNLTLNNNLFSFWALNGDGEYIIKGTVSCSETNNAFDIRKTGVTYVMYLYGSNQVEFSSAICSGSYPYTSNVAEAGATR